MRSGWKPNDAAVRMRSVAKVAAVLFIMAYTVIYLKEPFSDLWNIVLTNLLLVIASSTTAAIATMIWAHYEPADTPRRIWGFFAAGLWLWVVAELTWGYLNVTVGEVPEGISDVFWISGYFLFGQALLIQYRLLAHPTRREILSRLFIVVLSLLALYLLIYGVLVSGANAQSSFDAAINSFYPAADMVLALIALWLASHFIGGAFARPWLGLLAFAFADLMYAWFEITGLYSWSVNQANSFSTVTDIVYFGAYLILGLGVLSHWVFLRYGLRSPDPTH